MLLIKKMGKQKGNLLIFTTAFLWSFLGILIKSVGVYCLVVSAVCSFFGAAVLYLCNRKHPFVFRGRTLLAGIVLAGMHLTFSLANTYTTVANAIVLQYCSPIFVLIFNMLLYACRPKRAQLLALAACISGMVVFFLDQLGSGNMRGNILALISGVLFAGGFLLTADERVDAMSATMLEFLLNVPAGMIYMFVRQDFPDGREWALLIAGGILMRGVAGICYSKGIAMTTALAANMVALSEVFMAPLWAFLLFRESMGRFSLGGILLMVGAIVLECYCDNKGAGEAEGETKIEERPRQRLKI